MTIHGCIGNPCLICNNGVPKTDNTTNIYQTNKPVVKAWICPRCDSVNSPYVVSCPNCSNQHITAKFPQDRTQNCPCRKENGGSGICNCVLGNQIIN